MRRGELLSHRPDGFAIVCIDESFFIYDSLVRRVWIANDSRPIVTVTGSHRHSVEVERILTSLDAYALPALSRSLCTS